MEEIKEAYSKFEGISCLVITKSNFTYNTTSLKVLDGGVSFVDRGGSFFVVPFSEIKIIQEKK